SAPSTVQYQHLIVRTEERLVIQFFRDYSMTIDGKPVVGPKLFNAWNPATRDVIAQVPDATEAQLDAAVQAARAAFPRWSARPLAERQQALVALGAAIDAHAQDFMTLLTREQGKPYA